MLSHGHKEKISPNTDGNRKPRPRKVKWPAQGHAPGLNGHPRPRGEQELQPRRGSTRYAWALCGFGEAGQKAILPLPGLSTRKTPSTYCSNLKTYPPFTSHFKWLPLHLHATLKNYYYGTNTFCLGSNTERAIYRLILGMIWFSCE